MKAKKSLGQNFLKCSWVSSKMIFAANLQEGETALEIGPGKGALTKSLLRAGAKVVAVEKDKRLIEFLKDKFGEEIHKGQLVLYDADIKDIIKDKRFLKALGSYKLIANIPYYISGELLRMFLTLQFKPELIVFLVQKEVAQRVVSSKESLLSLSVKFFGEPEYIATVGKKCFTPSPKVDSAILKIVVKKHPPYGDCEEFFFEVIRRAFSSKRKKLMNNLSGRFDKDKLRLIFETLNLDQNIRAEDLSFSDWILLCKELESLTQPSLSCY